MFSNKRDLEKSDDIVLVGALALVLLCYFCKLIAFDLFQLVFYDSVAT